MALDLQLPIIYQITSGRSTNQTLLADSERLLRLITASVLAGIPLIQLREKALSAHSLYQLACRAAAVTSGSGTRLLINDRADIAHAAGADGVQLTQRSLRPSVVRDAFGEDFLIGVSAHSLAEVVEARAGGADFAVFGPVFATPSKEAYGTPLGLEQLRAAALTLKPFPLVAIGGITPENAGLAVGAGAYGVAAIRALIDPAKLDETVRAIRGETLLL